MVALCEGELVLKNGVNYHAFLWMNKPQRNIQLQESTLVNFYFLIVQMSLWRNPQSEARTYAKSIGDN